MAVLLRLDLDYRLKPGEVARFLEPDELAPFVERERAAPGSGLAAFDQALLAPRVSSYLLRAAMDLRYRDAAGRPSMPRSDGIGRWWGAFEAAMDARPASIELQPHEARWLVEAWLDSRVQDGFPRDHQQWLNVLDAELQAMAAHLLEEVTDGPRI